MRIPLRWLQEYLDAVLPEPREVADRLTDLGIEVEQLQWLGEGLEGAVVARVDGIRPHGQHLLAVEITAGRPAEVLTGAQNVRVGDLVAYAPPGCRLPDGRVIESATMAGRVSEGMLLSAAEIGLGPDDQGIVILDPQSAAVGADLGAFLQLPEPVLEVSLTPSFAMHAQSMLGVARELAASLDARVLQPELVRRAGRDALPLAVEIDHEVCRRYVAAAVEGSPEPTPLWMRRRLWAAGVRCHGAIVDVTNYVMLETGQPLHAFDYDTLSDALVVRMAREGETLTTLDGDPRTLGRDIVIADRTQAVGLAGVMGGLNTEVGANTRRVVLEAAVFDPPTVRRTARRLGLFSEAAARFARAGVDAAACLDVAERARGLLETLGLQAWGDPIDVYPNPAQETVLELTMAEVERQLGLTFTLAESAALLRRFGFGVDELPSALLVSVPTRRLDVTRPIDLVEEIARLHGYNRIGSTLPVEGDVGRLDALTARERHFRTLCLSLGFDEVVTTSMASAQALAALGLAAQAVPLANPLSEEQRWLRPTLLATLLPAVRANAAHQIPSGRLFDVGKIYTQDAAVYDERAMLALVAFGEWRPATWHQGSRLADWFTLRGALEALWLRLGERLVLCEGGPAYLHPGRKGVLCLDGRRVGYMGEVHPRVRAALDLTQPVVVAEIDLDAAELPTGRELREPSRYPSVLRDIAIVVGRDVHYAQVQGVITQSAPPALVSVELFDRYVGHPVPEDRQSLALHLTFQDAGRTLTEEEVDRAVRALVADLQRALGAEWRT